LREWVGRERSIIALVFTDIIDSTVIGKRLGDPAWIEALIKHFERARHYIAQYGGHEVKLVGDSCMVAFPTADKALLFALAFLEDTGDPLITIRAGIHVGTVRVLENDIYGLMVNYTSRAQHAMKVCGIAFSPAAKTEIESQLGDAIKELGKIRVLQHEPLKGFRPDEQLLWEIVTLEIRTQRLGRARSGRPESRHNGNVAKRNGTQRGCR